MHYELMQENELTSKYLGITYIYVYIWKYITIYITCTQKLDTQIKQTYTPIYIYTRKYTYIYYKHECLISK